MHLQGIRNVLLEMFFLERRGGGTDETTAGSGLVKNWAFYESRVSSARSLKMNCGNISH